jgi:uncharacterized protein YndB with AHSA1/START domain
MNRIEQTYLIAASPDKVWRALTDPTVIEVWSDADAEFEPVVGAEYGLWDGSIVGEIVEVAPRKKLAQTWQPDSWERADSVVTFTLKAVGEKTRVDLLHENVEEWDYEGTRVGWDIYYLGAIKRMLEKKSAKKVRSAKAAKGKAESKRKQPKHKRSG